jgi:predicted transcriptional regulator
MAVCFKDKNKFLKTGRNHSTFACMEESKKLVGVKGVKDITIEGF